MALLVRPPSVGIHDDRRLHRWLLYAELPGFGHLAFELPLRHVASYSEPLPHLRLGVASGNQDAAWVLVQRSKGIIMQLLLRAFPSS